MLKTLVFRTALIVAPLTVAACRGDGITDPAAAGTRAALLTAEPLRDPIIFVHGYGSSAGVWNAMIPRFVADGWSASQLLAWTYNSAVSNATIAAELSAKVDSVLGATGASRVDIVTHSMGGLSSRYYLRNLAGTAKVDAWVSLAGPNHGTLTATTCNTLACFEMRPRSAFLTQLNAGDETPGTVRYATFRSRCDRVIVPENTVSLKGAKNERAACLDHRAFTTDAVVYGQVRDWVFR